MLTWKPSSSWARGTTRSAPAFSSSFFISASSVGDTGFGAAATDRSTKTFAARSRAAARDAWLCWLRCARPKEPSALPGALRKDRGRFAFNSLEKASAASGL